MSSTAILTSFSNFLQNHQISLINGLLILFTFVGEHIFKLTTFNNCPSTQPAATYYGCAFFVGPFIVLTVIGMVVNNQTWRLCHGCKNRCDGTEHGCRESTGHCCVIFGRALIVPCAWLFVVFLDGNYFACMTCKSPCEKTSDEYKYLMAKSQIISWILLSALVLFSVIAICITRGCDSLSYKQYQYKNIYREEEKKLFDEQLKKTAEKMAKLNLNLFTSIPILEKEDWDKISKASNHKFDTEGGKGPFYTPLHEWAREKIDANPELCCLVENGDLDDQRNEGENLAMRIFKAENKKLAKRAEDQNV